MEKHTKSFRFGKKKNGNQNQNLGFKNPEKSKKKVPAAVEIMKTQDRSV